jgi:hypothetical protein
MAELRRGKKTFTQLKEELNGLMAEFGDDTSTKKCSLCLKESLCPSCGMIKKLIASRIEELEQILELMPLPCSYFANGCQVSMRPSELKIHEKSCDRQTIDCPVLDCEQNIFLAILTNHLQIRHKDDISKGSIGRLYHSILGKFIIPGELHQRSSTTLSWTPQWIECHGRNFFVELIRCVNANGEGTWMSWIYCDGITDHDAANFTCKIEYYRLDQRKSGSISYVGDPIPKTKDLEAITEERNCLILSDMTVGNILKGGTSLAYELTIIKKGFSGVGIARNLITRRFRL